MGQALVLGTIAGGIYGLFAVGIVLVYRGSGALNFAQGEIGTAGLYVAWYLVTDRGFPWWIGALGAVAVCTALGAGFERLVVRPMVDATKLSIAVATVGFLSFLLAVEFRVFSASPRVLRAPIAGSAFTVSGVAVSNTQVLGLIATGLTAAGLAFLLKRTDFGLGIVAASQDPVAARMVGIPVARVATFVWGAGAALTALGALMIEPSIGNFAPGYASVLFLGGLAGAVLGGLTSLPGAFVGGLVMGILEYAAKDVFANSSLPGISSLTTLVVIVAVLLIRPRGLLSGLRGAAAEAGT